MAEIRGQRTAVALDVSGEEKELPVFANGKTNRSTKLVLPVDIRGIVQRIILGQAATPIIFVGLAMNVIGPGFRHDVQQSSCGPAELWRESVGDDLKFQHRLDGNRQVLGFERTEVLAEEVVGRVGAVDHQSGVVALLPAQPDIAAQAGNHLGRGGQLRQITIVAAGEGKILQASGIEQLADAGGGCVHCLDVRIHGHRFLSGLQWHAYIERQ